MLDSVLTISGEKRKEEEQSGKNYCRAERCYGRFKRSFTLPSKVAQDKISASYKDGILTVKLLRAGDVKARKVKVDVA